MPLITDPDMLDQGVEVTINTTTFEFTLNEAGNLSSDGVTLQALYSFFKEEWKNDNSLIPFPFPMVAITPEQFEFVSGWKPATDATRKLIRTGGWREVAVGGDITMEFVGVITLGFIDPSHTAYFAFASDAEATYFTYPGPVNEMVQIFGDATNGDFDKRNETLTVYIREQGYTYQQMTTTLIGVNVLTNKVERFPLSEAVDLNISATDNDIETTAPYTSMGIEYFAEAQSKTIGGTPYDFGVVVSCAGATTTQIYEFIQYQLRQSTDIDTGLTSVIGLLADPLTTFVGNRLDTLFVDNPAGDGGGVFLDNFDSNFTNSLRLIDNTETYREYPFVSAGSINFNANLQNDTDAIYVMFFADPDGIPDSGDEYGSSGAIVVNDALGSPIQGEVAGAPSVSWDFDYDANTQGGRSEGTDADVVLVAIGLDNAQFVSATGVISRATGINFSLVAALERNYENPV